MYEYKYKKLNEIDDLKKAKDAGKQKDLDSALDKVYSFSDIAEDKDYSDKMKGAISHYFKDDFAKICHEYNVRRVAFEIERNNDTNPYFSEADRENVFQDYFDSCDDLSYEEKQEFEEEVEMEMRYED